MNQPPSSFIHLFAIHLPLDAWWCAGVAAACALLALFVRAEKWRSAAGWTALAIAGQACSLQLIWVGPNIHLQLFHTWGDLRHGYRALFFAAVFVQAILVVWGARKFIPQIRRAAGTLTLLQWLLVIGLICYGAVTIAPGVAQAFVKGINRAFLVQVVTQKSKLALGIVLLVTATLNFFLAACAIPKEAIESFSTRWKNSDRRWLPWAAALWVVVISSLIAIFVLERMPHLADEASYLFQAKYFSLGKLWLPPPVDPEAIYVPFYLSAGGKWFGTPAAGWPMVLAVGVFFGVPWLVNPLLGGAAILLAHAFLKKCFDHDVADISALLLAASPWLLYLSASLMTHPLTLVLSLLALLGVAHARESASPGWAAVAGLAGGALLHVRPLEAVVIAIVAGSWWLTVGLKKLRLVGPAIATAAGLAMVALFFSYNHALTADALKMPLEKYLDQNVYEGANHLGFGPNIGNFGWTGIDALPGHGPIDVVMNNNQNLYMAGFDLFGWACGSLLFVFLLLVLRGVKNAGVLWGVVFTTAGAMSLYWYSGVPDFGARYWYQMIAPLAALTVLGIREFSSRMQANGAGEHFAHRVWAFVAVATISSLVTVVPWRSLDKYYHYRGVNGDFRQLGRENNFGRSLVLVQWKVASDYNSAVALNPPSVEREVPETIYARIVSSESVGRLRSYYSDRPVWIVAGGSFADDWHPRVLAGPIAPGQEIPRNLIQTQAK